MKNFNKEEKVIHQIYKDLYAASTPSADFDELLANAGYNELGERVIDFNAYQISQEDFETIIRDNLNKTKFKDYIKNGISNIICTGCSPKFKINKNE